MPNMSVSGLLQPFIEACQHDSINGRYAVPIVRFVDCGVLLPVLAAFIRVERGIVSANDHKALDGGRALVAKILVAVADGLGKNPLAARMEVGVGPQKFTHALGRVNCRIDEHAVGRKQRRNLRGIKSAKR